MKKTIATALLLAALYGCKKDAELLQPKYDYSAVITAKMSDSTMQYNIFVKVDKFWIYVATKTRYEVQQGKTGFNVPYFVCNGVTYPNRNNDFKRAAIIERYSTGHLYEYAEKPLDSTHVTIIKNN